MKGFFASIFVTAAFGTLVMRVPSLRARVIGLFERFAEWHERGTDDNYSIDRDIDADVDIGADFKTKK